MKKFLKYNKKNKPLRLITKPNFKKSIHLKRTSLMRMFLTLLTISSFKFSIVQKVFSEYFPDRVLRSNCNRNTLALSDFFLALGSLYYIVLNARMYVRIY